MSNTGKIVQVIGAVVDVQFAANADPAIYQALTIYFTVAGKKELLTLEYNKARQAAITQEIVEIAAAQFAAV